jgi:hypothetical protein
MSALLAAKAQRRKEKQGKKKVAFSLPSNFSSFAPLRLCGRKIPHTPQPYA